LWGKLGKFREEKFEGKIAQGKLENFQGRFLRKNLGEFPGIFFGKSFENFRAGEITHGGGTKKIWGENLREKSRRENLKIFREDFWKKFGGGENRGGIFVGKFSSEKIVENFLWKIFGGFWGEIREQKFL